MVYKGWSTTPFDTLFTLSTAVSTRGYSSKLMKNRCRLELRRHFFLERVVNRWNGLDQHVIDSATLNSFKMGLDRIRKTSIGFFMDWLSAWPKASPIRIFLAGAASPGKNLVITPNCEVATCCVIWNFYCGRVHFRRYVARLKPLRKSTTTTTVMLSCYVDGTSGVIGKRVSIVLIEVIIRWIWQQKFLTMDLNKLTELANRLMKGGRGAGVGIGFLAAVGGAAYGLSHSMYTGKLV